MREETVKVYKFNELSDDAKKVARDSWRRTLDEDFQPYGNMITDSFAEELERLGYPNSDIDWRLSHSQGDGVAFYGRTDKDGTQRIVNRLFTEGMLNNEGHEFLNDMLEKNILLDVVISRNHFGHRYSHENTMEVEIETEEPSFLVEWGKNAEATDETATTKEVIEWITMLEEFVSKEVKEISRKLEKEGYQQIDHTYSDSTIDETLISNEYEYTEDGKMWF